MLEVQGKLVLYCTELFLRKDITPFFPLLGASRVTPQYGCDGGTPQREI
jgi:hypothetical protein